MLNQLYLLINYLTLLLNFNLDVESFDNFFCQILLMISGATEFYLSLS